jgi:hypothetical protein
VAVSSIAAAEERADSQSKEDCFPSGSVDELDVLGPARGLVFALLVAIPFWILTIGMVVAFA